MKKNNNTFFSRVIHFLDIILSTAGFVVKHATVPRVLFTLATIAFSIYLMAYQSTNVVLASMYFVLAELAYMIFIYSVLSKNGYRKWFIKKWGEEEGFLVYEAILGFIFLNLGTSIGYFAFATSGNLFSFMPKVLLFIIVAILFLIGFFIKVWAADVTTIDIYYWKDMFLGRKIGTFVVTGPYKYFSNPMYGVGQLHAYAIAIWAGSLYGILLAVLNQCLIFLFLYSVEKEFIQRIHVPRYE